MELLIADSGSTKTAWRYGSEKRSLSAISTSGLNPWHVSEQDFRTILESKVLTVTGPEFKGTVFFYGAGCASPEKKKLWNNVIASVFPAATINVETDMLGAARALCRKEAGNAAILGTGSNCCAYDGERIITSVPSTGYILGDEGSGVHIGKLFLRNFLLEEFDNELMKKLSSEITTSTQEIMDGIYRKPNANRFIASFAKIVTRHSAHPSMNSILERSFREFLMHSSKFLNSQLPFHFTGSVAYHNHKLLTRILEENGFRAGEFTDSPIDGLVEYHIPSK